MGQRAPLHAAPLLVVVAQPFGVVGVDVVGGVGDAGDRGQPPVADHLDLQLDLDPVWRSFEIRRRRRPVTVVEAVPGGDSPAGSHRGLGRQLHRRHHGAAAASGVTRGSTLDGQCRAEKERASS